MRSAVRGRTWILSVLVVCTWAVPAAAGTIGSGVWYEFGFDPNHAPLTAGCQPADAGGVPCRTGVNSTFLDGPPWTFVVATPVELTITDGLFAGDFFDVFDSGTLIGSTPSVPLTGASCDLDPSVCVLDPRISHATFLLARGGHSLTVDVHPAQLQGEGFLRVDPVPEPGTFSLIGVVLMVLYGFRKFRTPADRNGQ